MESHLYDENFDISSLCRELTMSRAQLYRKFSALTDMTVGKYLQMLRLYKARDLLADPNRSVTEVAMDVGFRNLSHFSAAFRKAFGVSPRKIHKE
jgi:AraC-like DNA-binding protein